MQTTVMRDKTLTQLHVSSLGSDVSHIHELRAELMLAQLLFLMLSAVNNTFEQSTALTTEGLSVTQLDADNTNLMQFYGR